MAPGVTGRVRTGAVEIGYRRVGAGPPLVLVNGFAATKADWDPRLLMTLAKQRELVCADPRGLGASTAPDGPFSIADMAGDVAALIESLELVRPTVLGWSMGGYISQELTMRRPDLVHRLVLVSTDPGGPAVVRRDPEARRALTDFTGTPREQARHLLGLLFPADRLDEVDRDLGELIGEARAAMPVDVLERQVAAMDAWLDDGTSARLGEIRAPTLVVTGTDDVVIPPENSAILATGIHDAWLARFPRSGHGLLADYANELAGLVLAFLDLKGWDASPGPPPSA